MTTPANEIHFAVTEAHEMIPAPVGHILRIYKKRRGGRFYLARGTTEDREAGQWEEIGPLTMDVLRWIFYEMVPDSPPVEEPEQAGDIVDMHEWTQRAVEKKIRRHATRSGHQPGA